MSSRRGQLPDRAGSAGAALRARLLRSGFTLLELILVLATIAMVSVLAVSAFFARSDVTLENAARMLAVDLRAAQARAHLEGGTETITFHPDGGGYDARDRGGSADAFPVRRFPADGVFEDVRIASVRLATGQVLAFDDHGRPSTDAAITLAQRGVARTVLVEAATGWITVEGSR